MRADADLFGIQIHEHVTFAVYLPSRSPSHDVAEPFATHFPLVVLQLVPLQHDLLITPVHRLPIFAHPKNNLNAGEPYCSAFEAHTQTVPLLTIREIVVVTRSSQSTVNNHHEHQ